MREPIISFKDYTYHYRSQAEPTIHNINLEIHKGERIIIVGPSGCGKSTLAHCLNGLNPFSYPGESTGSLTICGIEAAKSSIFELSQCVGTVLQDTDGQFIGMTVLEDIAFSMENSCVPQEEMIRRTRQEAGRVSLMEKLDAAPHELSGGQKQRVSMAGVMINRVPVLLFDEPLANLDPAAGRDAIELIGHLQKDDEKTVVIIEHRLEDAMHMGADRIILMENGRIISDSSPEELFLSDKLKKAGIREPLYLTALKYAGVALSRDMHVERMQTLRLDEPHKRSGSGLPRERTRNLPKRGQRCFGRRKSTSVISPGRKTLPTSVFLSGRGRWSALWVRTAPGRAPWQSSFAALKSRIREHSIIGERTCPGIPSRRGLPISVT